MGGEGHDHEVEEFVDEDIPFGAAAHAVRVDSSDSVLSLAQRLACCGAGASIARRH